MIQETRKCDDCGQEIVGFDRATPHERLEERKLQYETSASLFFSVSISTAAQTRNWPHPPHERADSEHWSPMSFDVCQACAETCTLGSLMKKKLAKLP